MSRTIVVPDDSRVFPPEARARVRALQQNLAAALRGGDLLRARGLRLSLEIQTIFWLAPDAPGAAA
jgi:hypothetical protein